MTRILAIASGRAGVGKTSLAGNLAAQLATRGQRVCLLDAGQPETGISQTLAETPLTTLIDSLADGGDMALPVVAHKGGFDVIPAGLDEERLAELDDAGVSALAAALGSFDQYDCLLVDTTSSITQGLLAFVLASPELLLVLTTEPEALSDAYALLKLLYSEQYEGEIKIVINKSKNQTIGRHCYDKFREVADFYLDFQMPLCAIIEDDQALADAGLGCLLNQLPQPSTALQAIDALAESLFESHPTADVIDINAYAERYLSASGAVFVDSDDDNVSMQDTHPSFASDDDLYQQLEFLSSQVDNLISEVARLRGAGVKSPPGMPEDRPAPEAAELYELRPAAAVSHGGPCSEACLAALASDIEKVTVEGETFPIYLIQKADGEAQRFAFQTIDDDLEEPEPKTTSS